MTTDSWLRTLPEDGKDSRTCVEHLRLQLEAIANNATLALFILDDRQHCSYMNPAAEQLTGFRLREVQGRPLHEVIHHTRPDGSHYPIEECPIDQAFPQNMREQGEEVFVHRDGSFYPVAFTASPIRVGDETVGTVLEVRGIAEEQRIRLEREQLVRELEAEREHLQSIFQQAPAFVATVRGPDHVFEMVNPPYVRLVGERDLLGKPVREALPEIEDQGFLELLDGVYRSGEPFVGNEMPILLRQPGSDHLEERFVNFVYQPLKDLRGRVTGILAHGVDVTDLVVARRQAEEQAVELEAQAEELQNQASQLEETQAELEAANDELLQANNELRLRSRAAQQASAEAELARAETDAFYHAAPVATALVDRDLRFRRINDALAEFYGLQPEEVIGKTLHEVVPHYADRVVPYYRQVIETGEPIRNLELTVPSRRDPSTVVHFLLSYFPVRVSGGEVAGVGLVALDVSDRYAVEEARKEDARMVETLQRIGHSLTAELDLQKVVQEVTDAATSLTGAQFGAFFYNVMNEKGESFTLYTISGVPREAFSKFPMPRNTPVFAPTFYGEGVTRSDDITKDPRYGHMAPYHGMPKGHLPVTSYLAVPVISRTGEVLGGLFFGHEEPGVFQERHERLAVGVAGWAAVAMDNARLYEAEHRARAEAERANRAKSDFLATMSHELRTPLNAMLGYTDLLLAGVPDPIPDGAKQKVERIGVSARHLLELIEEILTFSRLEAGEERVEIEEVHLNDVLQEVQALTEPLALAKGIDFECEMPRVSLHIHSDARKIRQILINLLGNAVKFTEQGEVRLSLEEIGNEIVFRVSDTGPGIDSEHLERIFAPFWQAEGGSTRTAGGTGLGLSVTRRLARLLGGDVQAISEPGRGSTFEVRLPTHAPEAVADD